VRRVAVAVIIVLLSAGVCWAAAAPGKMRCEFYRSYGCSATGCFDATEKAWSLVDWDRKTYSLCDNNGCHAYDFLPWDDGVYLALVFPGKELMAKLNLTDNSMIETSTFLGASITSFGNCARDGSP
jgi:hypothetical protein